VAALGFGRSAVSKTKALHLSVNLVWSGPILVVRSDNPAEPSAARTVRGVVDRRRQPDEDVPRCREAKRRGRAGREAADERRCRHRGSSAERQANPDVLERRGRLYAVLQHELHGIGPNRGPGSCM
jgi:hypothetical protein